MAATDYDFLHTRNEIIYAALRRIGALYAGDSPRAEDMSAAVDALHAMVADWQNEHIFLWTRVPITIPLVIDQVSYSLPTDARIFAIERAFYRDTAGTDSELEIISWHDYQEIDDKDARGRPDCVAISHGTSPLLYTWPVALEAGTLYCLGISQLKDFDSSSNIADFTARWQKALINGLASELAPDYGVSISEQQHLERKARRDLTKAKGGDRDRPTSNVVRGAYE